MPFVLRWLGCCAVSWPFVIPLPLPASFESHPITARSGGTADTYLALSTGVQGLSLTPAALSTISTLELTAAYERPFALSPLETQAISVAIPLRKAAIGLQYQSYGFSLYTEDTFAASLGYNLGRRLGLGLSVRSLRVSVEGLTSHSWIVFDLGVRGQFRNKLEWGLASWNVSGTQVAILGQGGVAGIAVEAAPSVWLLIDVRKESGTPTGVGAGLEYRWKKPITLRLGAGGQPERLSFGIGIRKGKIQVDYAGIYHMVLGVTHRVFLTFGADR